MERGTGGIHGVIDGQHGREALLFNDDKFRSVLGEVLVVGDDHGQRLSRVTCAVDPQDRLGGLLKALVTRHAADLAGREVLAHEDCVHSGCRAGLLDVDADDFCVRLGGSDESCGERLRNLQVGDETAVTSQQPVILPAGHRNPDEPGGLITRHLRFA